MVNRYEIYRRLEPAPPFENLDRGFAAEVADPAWFLGRQWTMGEHQGEDASSPISVLCSVDRQAIQLPSNNPLLDPAIIPPEAIVEAGPSDWWTPGRRIRIGKNASASLDPVEKADPALLLHDLPVPWDRFDRRGYDGYELYLRRATLGLDDKYFEEVPATSPTDLWDPSELCYGATFQCGGRTLELARHTGGPLDWYSVDSDKPLSLSISKPARTFVNQLSYPGAPHPRYWQIEDHLVDIGGFPPDRGHFATMLLIDLVVSHSDDWFLFPLETTSGSIMTLSDAKVVDSFGETWPLATPPQWSLFSVTGLAPSSLVVWATTTTPVSGPVLEDIALGIDEDANVLWAVEQRVHGRDMPTPARPATKLATEPALKSERKTYTYEPSSPMYPYWHPYPIAEVSGRRRFVQGRLADLTSVPPVLLPEPRASMLMDPLAGAQDPAHQIEPATIPTTGLRLERRMMLARGTDGRPVLWSQRRRLPLLAPPALRLEFDRLGEAGQ
jgi:hypothetical protein